MKQRKLLPILALVLALSLVLCLRLHSSALEDISEKRLQLRRNRKRKAALAPFVGVWELKVY